MRALGGFAVLLFFGLLGAAFVVGLSGWKGSDPRTAAGYYLGLFSIVLLAASLLGFVGSAAGLAAPRDGDLDNVIELPKGPRGPMMPGASGFEGDSEVEPETYPPRRGFFGRGGPAWDSRYSAGVGLLTSVLVAVAALWGLNVASNLTGRNLFTGKARLEPGGGTSPGGTSPGGTTPGGTTPSAGLGAGGQEAGTAA